MDVLITKAIGSIVKRPITGDDYVDRLHYFVTFAIMVAFAICSGIQACLFRFPNFLWRRLNTSSGTDLQKIRDLVSDAQNAMDINSKKLKMDEVVAYFEDWITGYRSYRIRLAGKHSAKLLTVLFCLGRKTGSFLSSLYIFIKILNFLNVILNFVVLSLLMNVTFWKYGFMVLESVSDSGDWQDSANFPRLLLCNFVLQGGKESNGATPGQETYQVQCLITINALLEKLFAIEWFWLLFLSMATLINLVSWAIKIKPPCSTILFSKSYMKILKNASADSKCKASCTNTPESFGNDLKGFVKDYLRSDGVFVVKLLELNASKTLLAELVRHLWNRYRIMNTCQFDLYRKDHRDDSNNNNNNDEYYDMKGDEHDSEESVVITTDTFL